MSQTKEPAFSLSLWPASLDQSWNEALLVIFLGKQMMKHSFGFLKEITPVKGRENKQIWIVGETNQQSRPYNSPAKLMGSFGVNTVGVKNMTWPTLAGPLLSCRTQQPDPGCPGKADLKDWRLKTKCRLPFPWLCSQACFHSSMPLALFLFRLLWATVMVGSYWKVVGMCTFPRVA